MIKVLLEISDWMLKVIKLCPFLCRNYLDKARHLTNPRIFNRNPIIFDPSEQTPTYMEVL
jgi:hypothetical protein